MTLTENVELSSEPAPEPEPSPARPSTPFWRRPWILPLAIVVGIWLYLQFKRVAGVPEDQVALPPHDNFKLYYPLVITHMCFGTLSMVTMVLQLWPWLRQNHPRVHRVSGRIYLLGVIVAAPAGLIIVWWAPTAGKLGGVSMLLFWLGMSIAAYVSVRRKNYVQHRRFMLYSFAVPTNGLWAYFAYLAIDKFQIPLDFNYYLEWARWFPWVTNLMLVQWWLYRTARLRTPLSV
jgi:uncharacterized membrane protein YozB (DUF420 family)